jgi:hypothetical protein
MKRAVPAATLAALLAVPAVASAHTGDVVIGQPVISTNSCKVHAEFSWTSFRGRSDVGAQVNVDGSAKVEDIVTIVGSGRKGYDVELGPLTGKHTVEGWSGWGVEGGGSFRHSQVVDCGTPKPQIVFVDRPVDRIVEKPILVPTPPKKLARCVASKTIVAYVAGRHGHHGPVFTRITVKDASGVVRGRTSSRKAETKRIPITAPCGTRLRLSASIVAHGRHVLRTGKVRLTDDGFSSVGVSFGRL